MLRFKIILYFIYYSVVLKSKPWRFSQLNKKYFNGKKGIFSKCEIEENIPTKWKLKSILLENNKNIEEQKEKIISDFSFPLFLKPEWGQNSHGIILIKNIKDLLNHLKNIKNSSISYMIQESCYLKNEYEILYTKNENNKIDIHSITKTINKSIDLLPINGIHYNNQYISILDKFSKQDLDILKSFITKIGDFNVGRIGIKSENIKNLLKGDFKIFEINIFLPMILSLLDDNISKKQKNIYLKNYIKELTRITKSISEKNDKNIFFRQIIKHYKIKIINNKIYLKIKRKIYRFIENNFLNGCSDYNSLDVRRLSRSKKQAREVFKKNDVPYAKGLIFINPYTAYKFVKKYGFPVCIKPNVGGYSRGSYFPINNLKDFWKAVILVKIWWPKSVIEQYLEGKNYRVVVTKDKVEAISQRFTPFVIGDGNSTIRELIKRENKIRRDMKLLPVIHEIEKSYEIKKYLKKQKLSFDSIPKKDENITLFYRIALLPGGVLENIELDKVTPKNKKLFIKILDLFHANIFGIDVIMQKGIDVDYDKQKTIFLEVNSRPYMKMLDYPRYGKKPDLTQMYKKLDKLEIEGKGIF